ncbi:MULTISPECIES: flagellar hook-associated protein 2 [unclassified Virgibacillus]|uniref:flagellar hook-associated protein 2 n=1 Tax=unclassified Virgibacillus TaxID=2620237 RepID=UPI0024DE4B7C|nr:flagellar hook-associated protein 2 [Virgibacillus sp. LDC-1]
MRIGGLASGMDIDELVNKLMTAERLPLNRMEQDRTTLTWKRDGFRDIYKSLFELKEMTRDMRLSPTYNSKNVSSSLTSAVTATANSKATNGSYRISVSKLASSAMNISGAEVSLDPSKTLVEQGVQAQTYSFSTYNKDGVEEVHQFEIKAEDKLEDVLKRITDGNNNVRMFFDEGTKKVVMETTRTGNYNTNGAEISFNATDNSFFSSFLNLDPVNEKGGEDAVFTYNDNMTLTSKDNNYTLNGITFQFNDVTNGATATLSVTNNVDTTFDAIVKFVDKYNEIVEMMNGTQQEERYRDYKPLTEEQKKDMSENEIKLWEEKAKSGVLRGEAIIQDGMYSMRQNWYANVNTGREVTSLTQIGIVTSSNYLDGGKLVIDEEKLKKALNEDPTSVQQLFANGAEGDSRGLMNRLDDSINTTLKKIEERAGRSTSTLDTYTLGKRMKDLNEHISKFENRLVDIEARYWRQFTTMEKAIQRMNQQSMQLMSQFGGGM